MSLIAKKPESSFIPCPEGLYRAVCVDVIDLGVLQTNWGDKHKARIVWQVEEENPETRRRFEVRKQYTLSLHEKAALRKDLEAWRGRKFTEDELRGFNLEKLIGVNCQVQVIHDLTPDGTIYANVQAIVPPARNTVKLITESYVRVKDKPAARGNDSLGPSEIEGLDPIPF